MTPTTNSLLASVIYATPLIDAPFDYIQSLSENELKDWLTRSLFQLSSITEFGAYHDFIHAVGQPIPQKIPVRIKHLSETALPTYVYKGIQVPLEPTYNVVNRMLMLSWVINHNRALNLVPFPGEPTLLGQAFMAALSIDVLLAFELAGLMAPKVYENWRLPNNEECPLSATVKSCPHYGACKVHFHNGEKALISTEHFLAAEVVRVESLESTATTELAGFIKKNTKQPELNEKQINELANKYV